MMKIVLIGYMGSGKSTIGKEVAKNVGIPFYDLDKIIEDREEDTVKNIFKRKGEIYFRKKESMVFRDFIQNNDTFILALGGGTPCYANNHEVLKNEDIVSFYLKGSIKTLSNRLEDEKKNRPLIASLSKDELDDYIRKHLFDRSYYYLQSKYIISIDEKSIEEITNEIILRLT
ncbi:shikimate kinase [Flavobacterium sp. 316]|uniref:Shikimate kinase n=2 Tax=Flavobacteriaceae TaxID=49546 RepID=A0ABY4HSY0_9FLAO|nr:shikimate kinase [Flavobacterium sp. 316]KIX22229.1 shikimate kinase [Flavobacterium sp. 316]UOX35633.1 shikimate kinase [Flavobacterium sediminilitoris]